MDKSGDDVWGGRGGPKKRQAMSTRMPDVVFPNDSNGGGQRIMLVAIGLEGLGKNAAKRDSLFFPPPKPPFPFCHTASTTPSPPSSTIAAVRSITGDSGLAVITETAHGDCRRRRWWPMTMALNSDGTQELATDDDGQGTRPGAIIDK